MKNYNKYFVILIIFLSGKVSFAATQVENRIILDERFNWLTQQSADRLLSRIKEAGFNIIVPCVWHGRGVSWPSSLAPIEPLWQKEHVAGYDPLAYLIKKAHMMDIEVHPWFTVALRQNNILPRFAEDGVPEKSFNIHLPAFRQFITSLMLEVVEKYDIDGINLDYVRSKGICTSKTCVNDYQTKTDRNLLKDKLFYKVSQAARQSIEQWNGDAVITLLLDFINKARAVKPDLLVSVDSHAGYEPLLLQGANSIKWLNEGIVDVVFHMDYGENLNIELIKSAKGKLNKPEKMIILVGNYQTVGSGVKNVIPRNSLKTAHLIKMSRQYGNSSQSVALYQYRFLTDDQIIKLKNGPFREMARSNWNFVN